MIETLSIMCTLSTSSSIAERLLVFRYARDRVSTRYISRPGLYRISTSYLCNLSRSRCKRLGAFANGFLDMETSGL